MKKITTLLAIALSGLFASHLSAAIVLESVDWGSSSGSSFNGVWSYGNVDGTTESGVFNAGASFPLNWGGMPYGAGYTTSVNEAIVLAAGHNTTAAQTVTFSGVVSSLYLFFAWVDNDTSFNFGSYDWTLVGANSAARSGNSVVISGSNDQQSDGFLVNINETFGPGTNLVFDFVNPVTRGGEGGQSVGFNLAQGVPAPDPSGVPEPGQVAASLLLLGGIGGYVFLKRRKAAKAGVTAAA